MSNETTVAALDFGNAGYVRIDAAGVSEDAALDIASDIIAWARSMRAKYQCPQDAAAAEA